MKYVNEVTANNSPFQKGTTPVMKQITAVHSVQSTESIVAGTADATDWNGRNWALHTQFVSHLDVYRGVVEDGSNVVILADDFWNDGNYRTSLESSTIPSENVAISNKLMSLVTSNNISNLEGTLTYEKVLDTLWNQEFVPKRIRIQSVQQIPAGTAIKFIFSYTTNLGPQVLADIIPSESNNQWITLPVVNGDLQDFTLSVVLTNSITGGNQPTLGQFVLILKD